jgi:hypothetical protein
MDQESERLQPLLVPTRRGVEQEQHFREMLARIELAIGLAFAKLITETISRLQRCHHPGRAADVSLETAIGLDNLRRASLAITL